MMRRLACFGLLWSVMAGAESLFPLSYEESRARFRDGCAEAQARGPGFCRGYAIPSDTYGDLSVDVAYFSRGGSRLLVLQSGTHGPEGYAGAAIQDLVRQKHLGHLLDRGIDVLMVHALNPFGYRSGRRTDENNIDLNRNFLADGESYARPNADYRRMRSTFEPIGVVGGATVAYARVDLGLLGRLVQTASVRRITTALMGGQSEFERGMTYGGRGPVRQVGILRDVLTPLIHAHRKTLFVDLHTGLGRRGALHLAVAHNSNPDLVTEMRSPFASLADEGIETTVVAKEFGFYVTTGGVDTFVAGLGDESARVMGVVAEFGTMGTEVPKLIASAHRMIVENQAWFQGCEDAASCARVRHDYVGMFNPPDQRWREDVLRRADRFVNAVARSFK